VEITRKNNLSAASQSEIWVVPNWEIPSGLGCPPPPPPSESLAWRGVCKNGLQNIERLGVRGQNLDFKELTGFFASHSHTAFAMAIICFPKFSRKGRCHIGLWISLESSPITRVRKIPTSRAKNAREMVHRDGQKPTARRRNLRCARCRRQADSSSLCSSK
jgi:hypothetical protein